MDVASIKQAKSGSRPSQAQAIHINPGLSGSINSEIYSALPTALDARNLISDKTITLIKHRSFLLLPQGTKHCFWKSLEKEVGIALDVWLVP